MSVKNFAAAFVSDKMIIAEGAFLTDTTAMFFKVNYENSERLFYITLPKRDYTSRATKAFIKLFNDYNSAAISDALGGQPLT